MSSMREVAELAGVSVSTVAAVINENKFVSPERKRRIEMAILQTGYRKRRASEGDELRRSVAVILPGTYSSFFPPLLNGISDVATEENMLVTLCDSSRSIQREKELLQMCRRRGIRNIILDSVCDMKHEAAYFSEMRQELLERYGMNIVVLERRVENDAFFSVYVDNYASSYEITRHLVECGCRHLAHIGGASVFPHAKRREEAFLRALMDSGIPFDQRLLLRGDFSPLSGYGVVRELLDKGIRVDGIFAANDQMAIGAMKALNGSGLRIPQDVAVAGFDNLSVSSLVTPGLTTVQFPIYQMGYQAARIIADRLDGKTPPQSIRLESRIIIRDSTQPGKNPSDWNLQGW